MLQVANIMKNYGFDSKVMFSKKGKFIAPHQNKDVPLLTEQLSLGVRSGCTSLLALRSRSPGFKEQWGKWCQ